MPVKPILISKFIMACLGVAILLLPNAVNAGLLQNAFTAYCQEFPKNSDFIEGIFQIQIEKQNVSLHIILAKKAFFARHCQEYMQFYLKDQPLYLFPNPQNNSEKIQFRYQNFFNTNSIYFFQVVKDKLEPTEITFPFEIFLNQDHLPVMVRKIKWLDKKYFDQLLNDLAVFEQIHAKSILNQANFSSEAQNKILQYYQTSIFFKNLLEGTTYTEKPKSFSHQFNLTRSNFTDIQNKMRDLQTWLSKEEKNTLLFLNWAKKIISMLFENHYYTQALSIYHQITLAEKRESSYLEVLLSIVRILDEISAVSFLNEFLLAFNIEKQLPDSLIPELTPKTEHRYQLVLNQLTQTHEDEYILRMLLIHRTNSHDFIQAEIKNTPHLLRFFEDQKIFPTDLHAIHALLMNYGIAIANRIDQKEFQSFYRSYLLHKIKNLIIDSRRADPYCQPEIVTIPKAFILFDLNRAKPILQTHPSTHLGSGNILPVDPGRKPLFKKILDLTAQISTKRDNSRTEHIVNARIQFKHFWEKPKWINQRFKKIKSPQTKNLDLLAFHGKINSFDSLYQSIWLDFQKVPTFSLQIEFDNQLLAQIPFHLGWQTIRFEEDHSFRMALQKPDYLNYQIIKAYDHYQKKQIQLREPSQDLIQNLDPDTKNPTPSATIIPYQKIAFAQQQVLAKKNKTHFINTLLQLSNQKLENLIHNQTILNQAKALQQEYVSKSSDRAVYRTHLFKDGTLIKSTLSNYHDFFSTQLSFYLLEAPFYLIWNKAIPDANSHYLFINDRLTPFTVPENKSGILSLTLQKDMIVKQFRVHTAYPMNNEQIQRSFLNLFEQIRQRFSQKPQDQLTLEDYFSLADLSADYHAVIVFTKEQLKTPSVRSFEQISLAWTQLHKKLSQFLNTNQAFTF